MTGDPSVAPRVSADNRVADDRAAGGTHNTGYLDVFERIEDVPGLWDDLVRAGGGLGLSRPFLSVVEETAIHRRPKYFFVYRTPCGAAAIALGELLERPSTSNPVMSVLLGRLYRQLPDARNWMLPLLMLRPELSSDDPVVAIPSTRLDRKAVLDGMMAAIDSFAARSRWSSAIDCVPVRDTDLSEALASRRYLRTTGRGYAELELVHDSWETFLAAVKIRSTKVAGMIRNEERRARRDGLKFREWDPARDDTMEFHGFLDVHAKRLNGQPFPFGPEFLPTLARTMGQDVHVLVAERGGQTQGVAVLLTHGTRGYVLYPGLIDKEERSGLVYFNLAYYQSIRLAIDLGLERLAYGNGVYPAKIRRGCSITMTEIHFRPRSDLVRLMLRGPTARHRRFLERKFAPLRDAVPFSFPKAK